MPIKKTNDINIINFKPLITPEEIKSELPIQDKSTDTVLESRQTIANILVGKDRRKFVIMGPCSIHDEKAALEYAAWLKDLAKEVQESMFLVMRVYFEKPRTTTGWKGYINDPSLDNSFNINDGLRRARQLLIDITKMGMPAATEALEPISPQYFSELISWTAIGARTTESQTHRELASGLSSPVGFKNNTDGNIEVAINAMKSAEKPHHFLGIDQRGRTSIVSTSGNPYCHLILRGGKGRPNYDSVSVAMAQRALRDAGLTDKIVIDCSHDNSSKDYRRQSLVFDDCVQQIVRGNHNIVGLMLESHLFEGNQPLSPALNYGVSITDACIGLAASEKLIMDAHNVLKKCKN
jgi:3-deoxy-7-phosphoheptulonate synthase